MTIWARLVMVARIRRLAGDLTRLASGIGQEPMQRIAGECWNWGSIPLASTGVGSVHSAQLISPCEMPEARCRGRTGRSGIYRALPRRQASWNAHNRPQTFQVYRTVR